VQAGSVYFLTGQQESVGWARYEAGLKYGYVAELDGRMASNAILEQKEWPMR